MTQPLLNIETRDYQMDSTGDLVMNDKENRFQNFWGDCICEKGSFVFLPDYGIPHVEIANFGRTKATDNLIESYVMDKAEKNELYVREVIIEQRIPDYEIRIEYVDENQQDNFNTLTLS